MSFCKLPHNHKDSISIQFTLNTYWKGYVHVFNRQLDLNGITEIDEISRRNGMRYLLPLEKSMEKASQQRVIEEN